MTTFKNLAVGDLFNLSGLVETGLLMNEGKPGSKVYEKVSARRYRAQSDGYTCNVGSINCKVWKVNV